MYRYHGGESCCNCSWCVKSDSFTTNIFLFVLNVFIGFIRLNIYVSVNYVHLSGFFANLSLSLSLYLSLSLSLSLSLCLSLPPPPSTLSHSQMYTYSLYPPIYLGPQLTIKMVFNYITQAYQSKLVLPGMFVLWMYVSLSGNEIT